MGKLLDYIAKETQGECFASFKYCYDNMLPPNIEYEAEGCCPFTTIYHVWRKMDKHPLYSVKVLRQQAGAEKTPYGAPFYVMY